MATRTCGECFAVNERDTDWCMECHARLVRLYVIDEATATSRLAGERPGVPPAAQPRREEGRTWRSVAATLGTLGIGGFAVLT
ncbi:MAG: hypothetical protein M3245_06360, partial [Actinomycetota bacterium]|nr:hypothetical protein [Actinomycetota bacterium]